MVATLLGIVTLPSFPQPLNASFPMVTTLLGIVTLPKPFPTKAWFPISTTLFGIMTLVRPLYAKALSHQPSVAAVRFGAGRAALAKREYRRAVDQLTEAITLDPRATKTVTFTLAGTQDATLETIARARAACAADVTGTATTRIKTIAALVLEAVDVADPVRA